MGNDVRDVYSPEKGSLKEESYQELLPKIQKYFTDTHTALYNNENIETHTFLEIQKKLIDQYLLENKTVITGLNRDQLVEKVYNDMAGFGVLDELIYEPGTRHILEGLEEVDVNSWEDIEVIYNGKGAKKAACRFNSPEDAKNMFDRILAVNLVKMDYMQPTLVTYLDGGIRICVNQFPVVSKSTGVSASIRIVNPNTLNVERMIRDQLATRDMTELLYALHSHGVSLAFSGGTSTGKTTFASAFLKEVPDEKRILIIEEGTYEINIVRRDSRGHITNSVVSLKTRPNVQPEYNITASKLIERALTMNPDYIVIAEMKGEESIIAAEAAITGQVGITTIHANEAGLVYERMVDLGLKKYPTSDKTALLKKMMQAFPIVVHLEKYADRTRRICEIAEAVGIKDGEPVLRTLYSYDPRTQTHQKMANLSSHLQNLLLKKGLPRETLDHILEGACEE